MAKDFERFSNEQLHSALMVLEVERNRRRNELVTQHTLPGLERKARSLGLYRAAQARTARPYPTKSEIAQVIVDEELGRAWLDRVMADRLNDAARKREQARREAMAVAE